jgi:hypothetical protein
MKNDQDKPARPFYRTSNAQGFVNSAECAVYEVEAR